MMTDDAKDMLRPYLPKLRQGPNVLELFARCTLAGPQGDATDRPGIWVSVGNEPIKFNVKQSDTIGGWLRSRVVPASDGQAEQARSAETKDKGSKGREGSNQSAISKR